MLTKKVTGGGNVAQWWNPCIACEALDLIPSTAKELLREQGETVDYKL
jgi:hypothetical protein